MAVGDYWAADTGEPKRSYRWLLSMQGVDAWIVKTAKKPGFSISESQHDFLNYRFFFPGRVTWDDVQITLVDPVSPDASQSLYNLLKASGWVDPIEIGQNLANPMTMSKANSVAALGDVKIRQIDTDGQTYIEEWQLMNAWIKQVDFGNLDYSTEDLVNIQVTLKYDWARLNSEGLSVANQARATAWSVDRMNDAQG